MKVLRDLYQALSGGGFKGIEQAAIAKFTGLNFKARKSVLQQVQSSVAFVSDSELTVELPIGEHEFEYVLHTTMAAAGGMKNQFIAGPGFAISEMKSKVIYFADGVAPAMADISGLSAPIDGGTATAWTLVLIKGSVVVTSQGVLQMQWSQAASNGTPTRILAGSTLVTNQIN